NPHAQRIVEAMNNGAELAVMDPRLSNTASAAKYWMPTYPGSEAAVLLAMAKIILTEGLYNREFMEHWVNWRAYLKAKHPGAPQTFESFIAALVETYKAYTPEFAAAEAGIDRDMLVTVARRIGAAGTRFSAHNWRGPGQGNLGGWAVARTLHFLSVLTGSVGTLGGTLPNAWNKFKPKFISDAPPQKQWNELHYLPEYPLSFHEMSQILPHLLKDGRGKLDTYFTRVFNPVWTYPDGFTWVEVLRDEKLVRTHVALTPTWNETAYYADYVLPMGHSAERHDLNSYETHASVWIAFRQPVLRRFLEEQGKPVDRTWQANPGEVWEEDEFWIDLSWAIDPDGAMGIRKYFESVKNPGQKLGIEEYYRHIFDHTPGLKEAAAKEGLDPYGYMAKYGAFEVEKNAYNKHMAVLSAEALKDTRVDEATGDVLDKEGKVVGIMVDGKPRAGFPTPSKRQEYYSQTMEEWGWPEHALPGYIKSHIHPDQLNKKRNEFVLVPTFRLPTHIHSRSANAKWLVEIAHRNPIWMSTQDAERMGYQTNDLVKLVTDIGSFVDKVWVTEAVKPGVICCSHHIGRWQLENNVAGNSWMTNTVRVEEKAPGKWKMHTVRGIEPFESADPDSSRIYWQDGGVHQNITHAVHPDPISGAHCWHQRVRIEKPGPDDTYGDIHVDTNESFRQYKEWMKLARPADRPDGLRRPQWFTRVLRPAPEMFFKKK
ncbi:MAG: molybdopterin-dependent oxidoreductase, partial [Deltaproteobacteria bacterium]|nr:molybdopterin-dependent oxidoreductase [Deltaproteobacteria bacterium]